MLAGVVVLALFGALGLAGAMLVRLAPGSDSATAQLDVDVAGQSSGVGVTPPSADARTASLEAVARLATTPAVLLEARAKAGIADDVPSLGERVTARVDPSGTVTISATGGTLDEAAALADAVATTVVARVPPTVGTAVLSSAALPDPGPDRSIWLPVGLLACLAALSLRGALSRGFARTRNGPRLLGPSGLAPMPRRRRAGLRKAG